MSSGRHLFGYLRTKRIFAFKSMPKDKFAPKPIKFCALFIFTTGRERIALFAASIFSIIAGTALPFINLLYGELTNVFIDRQFPTDEPSHKTVILEWFGGGRVLVNGSMEERMKALDEDAIAFVTSVSFFSTIALIFLALSIFVFNLMAAIQVQRMRVKLFQTMLSQSAAWFDLKGHGNITHKITEDLHSVQNGIGERLAIFIYQMSTTVIILGVSFYIGWLLTLVLLSCVVPMFVIFLVLSQIQSSVTAKEVASDEIASDLAEEVFNGIRTVYAYSGEEMETKRYAEKLLRTQSLGIKKGIIAAFGIGFVWIIIYACYAVAFALGFRLILWRNDYNPTVLISVFFGVLTAATILSYSGPYWESFANARGSAAIVFRIFGTKSDINPFSDDGISGDDSKGGIEFKNVHFHYPSRPENKIMNGLSFKINPGEKVAIVGGSGSGKSTVLQLIQRLYDPVEGDIFLDGMNLKSLNVSWLRRQMGVVLQEPVMFTGTVRENIAYGLDDVADIEIREAAKMAQAHEFILHLPDEYDTVLAGRTGALSKGQKQKIAIARAIIRKPKILLLDEITSALDNENSVLVQNAITKASADLTTVIVTHNLSSLTTVDRIIVLQGGVVAEEGNHANLVALNGIYSRLLKAEAETKDRSVGSMERQEESLPFPASRGALISDNSLDAVEKVEEKLQGDRVLVVNCFQFLLWNKSHWPFLYFGILFSIMIGSIYPIFGILFGELVGLLADIRMETVYQVDILSITLALIGIACGIFNFMHIYFLDVASTRLGTYLRLRTFETMLRQEIGWFEVNKNSTSDLCDLLNTHCSALQSVIGSKVGIIAQGFTAMLLGIFISMYYSWKMTMVTSLVIPFIFFGIFMDRVTSSKHRKLIHEAQEKERKITTEAVDNIKLVNSLGCESLLVSQYAELVRRYTSTHVLEFLLRGFAYSTSQTTIFFGYAASLWFGAYLMKTENLHYKNVIKVSELIIFGCWILAQAVALAPNFRNAREAAGRLQYLFHRKPRINSGTHAGPPFVNGNKDIYFSSVYFSYPERPKALILRNINLSIRDGESIALIGESGSGKSTIIQLILRFYDPSLGSISIGRMNLRNFKLSSLRQSMAIISQEPDLFDRTIYENIAYGNNAKEVAMEEVIAAAKAADIHNFISSLPEGYQTKIGKSLLSGGQKQKIAIARALIRNPRILLLDEATSALDPESERSIQETLDRAMSGRTTITVAHKWGAIVNASKIYVLTEGRITESGSHLELMKKRGFYYKMRNEYH